MKIKKVVFVTCDYIIFDVLLHDKLNDKQIILIVNGRGNYTNMKTENNNFLLTIAIPTYNRKKLLKRAIESIIPQLNSKVEVLVSDNASDDGTDEMMTELFPMVRYIKNTKNMGVDCNFLQCYRKARGKYVILLGSDDRFADDALDYLTDFLEKNDCDLVFLNFRCFDVTKESIYIKNGEKIKNYKEKEDIVTMDRNLFMKYANHSITFMSASVAKTALLMDVKAPEHFIGTYFIHTNIMLESVNKPKALFGVIMKPLIEANATAGESEMSKTPEKNFTVFGKHMYSTLCVHAVECGFQEKIMKKVYLKYLYDYPFWRQVLSLKRHNNGVVMENFWKDGYPVVKHFPTEWIKVMVVVLMPQCIIDMTYKVYKTLKKSK